MKKSVKFPFQHFGEQTIIAHHPDTFLFKTDKRYGKFANDLYLYIISEVAIPELKKGIIDLIVIKSTMYLEDIVSELGIWETFVTLNQEMFGKKLPFFKCSKDYVINEPNIEDIKYLIWSSAMELDRDAVYNPCAIWIEKLAEIVYDFLDYQFEEVPINEQLRQILYEPNLYNDIILVRSYLMWLFNDCYLTKGINCEDIIKFNVEFLSNGKLKFPNSQQILYEVKTQSAFAWKTGPMALYPKEFLAKMLELKGCEKEAKAVKGILYYPKQLFKIEKADKDGLSLISIRKEKIYISSTSFSEYNLNVFKSKDCLLAALIVYKEKAEVNGISVFCDSGNKFEFENLTPKKEKVNNKFVKIFDDLMKQSDNTGLLFFKDVNEFSKTGFPIEKGFDNAGNIVCYLDKDSKITLSFTGMSQAIKSPNNPYYDKKEAPFQATDIVMNRVSVPFLMYLIKNKLLPDAGFSDIRKAGDGKKVFQDNIEFLARYSKQENWIEISEFSTYRSQSDPR